MSASLTRSLANIGLTLAAGDIVAFTDDDAIPNPDWIERHLEPYADELVAAVGGPVFDVPCGRVDWQLCTCTRLGVPDTNSPGPIERYLRPGADPFVYLAGCNMSFRRDRLVQVGGFNSLLAYVYDDADVCARLIDSGHRIAYADEALVEHDRAPNAVRDGHQHVRDPYLLVYSRAVASRCSVDRPTLQRRSTRRSGRMFGTGSTTPINNSTRVSSAPTNTDISFIAPLSVPITASRLALERDGSLNSLSRHVTCSAPIDSDSARPSVKFNPASGR